MKEQDDSVNEPEFWRDPDAWQVLEMYHPINVGVQNETHDEIVSSVLDDLLVLHFSDWEFGIPWYDLFRFIQTSAQANRVLEALCDERVQNLIIEYTDTQIIRLKPDHDSLQTTMDIAGRWYDGYEIPDGITTISLTEKGDALLGELGVDELSKRLAHEFITGEKLLP